MVILTQSCWRFDHFAIIFGDYFWSFLLFVCGDYIRWFWRFFLGTKHKNAKNIDSGDSFCDLGDYCLRFGEIWAIIVAFWWLFRWLFLEIIFWRDYLYFWSLGVFLRLWFFCDGFWRVFLQCFSIFCVLVILAICWVIIGDYFCDYVWRFFLAIFFAIFGDLVGWIGDYWRFLAVYYFPL